MTIICSQQYVPIQQTARATSTSFVHPFQVDGRMEIKSRITATTIMTAAKMRMACGLLRSLKPCSNAVDTRMLPGRTISAAARDSKRRDCGLCLLSRWERKTTKIQRRDSSTENISSNIPGIECVVCSSIGDSWGLLCGWVASLGGRGAFLIGELRC